MDLNSHLERSSQEPKKTRADESLCKMPIPKVRPVTSLERKELKSKMLRMLKLLQLKSSSILAALTMTKKIYDDSDN